MRQKLVYSLMFLLSATAILSSCSNETDLYDPAAADQVQHDKFASAFEKTFGKVAPNVNWGFDDEAEAPALTRGDGDALPVPTMASGEIIGLGDFDIKPMSEAQKRAYLKQLVNEGINIGTELDIYQLDAFGFRRIICEDLYVSENCDFDYNDAVFDAKRIEEAGDGEYATFYTILRAEGAHKAITIGDAAGAYEVHDAFDVSKQVFVNTVGKARPTINGAYWQEDHDPVVKIIKVKKVNGKEPTLIDIPVYAEDNDLPLTSKRGEPAEKICVTLDYSWVSERQHMGNWYPKFTHYVTGVANTSTSDSFGDEFSWWFINDNEWRTPDPEPEEQDLKLTQLYEAYATLKTFIKNDPFDVDISSHEFSEGKGAIKFENDGKPTYVKASGFKDATDLTKIFLPSTVTKLGNSCFSGCTNLSTIDLSKITEIGNYAFEGCTLLPAISIPAAVKVIKTGTFKGCTNLGTISLLMYIESIGDEAFMGCTSLSTLSIPYACGQIGQSAFEGCTSLNHIAFAEQLSVIGQNAFAGCTSLNTISIPSSVSSIAEGAFAGCTALATVEIAGNVNIGPKAFENCTSLTTVTCRATTPPVGNPGTMFAGCSNLTAIYVPAESVNAYKTSSTWSAYAQYIQAIQE